MAGLVWVAGGSFGASVAATDGIRAEVTGTLQKHSRGPGQADFYFISVKAAPFFEENRVWLQRAEDKNRELDSQLQALAGKKVLATGQLKQRPDKTQSTVPRNGMYLEASGPSFEIKELGPT